MKPIYFIILFITSCAQQTILTGGDKDITAPLLLVDSNFQNINYQDQSLSLQFNERIQFLKDKRALIINPEIVNFTVKEENNKLNIAWEDTLKKETTYSFIFKNSIADITEANKIKKLNYVFSTGAYIDTGQIVGSIYKYPEKSPLENALIYAVGVNAQKFTYKGYTNKKGDFILKNVKMGDYLLYAFDDGNNNNQLDTLSEVHGFILDTLSIKDSLSPLSIICYEPDSKITIDKIEFNHLGKLSLTFNTAIDSCKITDLTTGNNYISNSLNENHQFYFMDTIDKHTVVVQSKNNIRDTIRISFKLKSNLSSEIVYKEYLENFLTVKPDYKLEFNQYIKYVDTSLINIFHDSSLVESSIHYDKNLLTISPKKNYDEFTMVLLPKSICGIKTIKEDTSTVNFIIKRNQKLSDLAINIKSLPFKKSILQVLRNDKVVMKIPINNHEIDTTINRCLPGKYKLILIADLDENGYWTKGDIVERRLPEPIFDYDSEIELKKNWTNSITWNFKDED